MRNSRTAPAVGRKELRLGLVCYGGVSLAIYMHGATKEIHRAVRASVLEEQGLDSEEGAHSEKAYRALLATLAEKQGVRTTIVVDSIAGSSAGGINGIFLAKALAHDLSQDSLRDLWFEHGDLGRIVRRPTFRLRGLTHRFLKRLLPGDDSVPSKDTWADIGLALAGVAKGADSLFDGNEMAVRIYDALHGMQPVPPADLGTLMPQNHPLELWVTVTDHGGYRRFLPLTDPAILAEAQHRHLLEFRYREGRDDFDGADDGALTLAARATSSLPLGFQAINPETFPGVLPEGATSVERLKPYFRPYTLSEADPAWAYLVDGGVLDNKPFGPVIKAIKDRRARTEVDRYLVYLEPDPHPLEPRTEAPKKPPPLSLVVGALSGLPRSEPILDELHDVLVRNQQVRAVRDVIETNWDTVADLVTDKIEGLADPPADPGVDQLKEWNQTIHEEAVAQNRLGQPGYVRLKISSALDSFGKAACLVCDYTDDSNQTFLVREILRIWAERRGLFEQQPEPTELQREFVATFDLAFAQRRLEFVIAGVSWLYRDLGTPGSPTREQLDLLKDRLYDAVAAVQRLSSGVGFSEEVLQGIGACFGEELLTSQLEEHQFDIEDFLAEHGTALDDVTVRLKAFLDAERPMIAPALYKDLVEMTSGWNGKIRRDLLIRYLGFPIWDALLYPVQALSEVAERDEIRVMRLSPLDSDRLSPRPGESKIEGAALGHAFAFFSREARESDYLWGRLDAAERIVRLLLTPEHPDYIKWCQQVFRAVLKEDEAHLTHVRDIVDDIADKVEALSPP